MKDYSVGNENETLNKSLVKEMNGILADEYVLFTKTLKFHWNLRGRQFLSLHQFFGDQYNTLLVKMDDLAERIRTIDAFPVGTLGEIEDISRLSQKETSEISQSEMIDSLLLGHHSVVEKIKSIVKQDAYFVNDPGTEDFMIGLLQWHEKQVWMLKSQLS